MSGLPPEERSSCHTHLSVLILLFLLMGGFTAHSAVPSLDHIRPVGFARGTTNTVKMAGKGEPWPPQVWVAGEGVLISALTNKNELQFIIEDDAPKGARLFRLFNAEGASEPRLFVVSDGPELIETEPNDYFTEPMPIDTLPVRVNGRLDKSGDVDSFRVKVPAGRRLTAAIESHVLMSKLDAVLRLVNPAGYQLAWNHDFATIDPRLEWWAEEEMEVVLQVYGFAFPATASVRLTGGEGAIYRLHLSLDDPEAKPANDLPSEISLPASVHAFIEAPGAKHRLSLQLAKDEWISASVAAESLGSPLDAWLAVENKEGKELKRSDDADGSRDPAIDWKAPDDGRYTVVVGSLTRNAGPEYFYQLDVHGAVPDWSASLAANSLVVKPGSTNELKLTFNRLRGFTNEIQITAEDLPERVTIETVIVPEKGGEVTLGMVVSEDVAPWQGPIQVFAHESGTTSKRAIPFRLTASTVNNGVPGGYRVLLADELDHMWLTVLEEEEPQPGSNDE